MRTAYVLSLPLVVAASTVMSQSLPDGAELLEREATALDSYVSYGYEERTTMSMKAAGMPLDIVMDAKVSGKSPGKRRLEMRTSGAMAGGGAVTEMDRQLLVSDGRQTWLFMSALNVYMRMSDDAGLAQAIGNPLAGMALMAQPSTAPSKVLRSEVVQIDGTSHDCWVVESRIDGVSFDGVELSNMVATSWIDKQLGVAVRRAQTFKLGSPLPADVRVESEKRAFTFNEPLPDSLFVFTPPPGAKEMDLSGSDLAILAGGAAPGPSTRSSSPKGVGARTSSAPQAYVPTLRPLVQTEPEWPTAAREQRVSGMVQLLLTLDSHGAVTSAEALTGPGILRPAAVEAVRQWRFTPVVREGVPVSAYTSTIVTFLDHANPLGFAPPALDMKDEIAAAERLAALAVEWPRTPEQELADLESDSQNPNPFIRRQTLAKLAKAAHTAGAAEKAAQYANEALSSSAQGPMVDGDAIHDAHLVLGHLAFDAGDTAGARRHLLDAGKTPGSPVLNSFGPDFSLAQRLLTAGERDTVVEYLTMCGRFWSLGAERVRDWTTAIKAGRTPVLDRSVQLNGTPGRTARPAN